MRRTWILKNARKEAIANDLLFNFLTVLKTDLYNEIDMLISCLDEPLGSEVTQKTHKLQVSKVQICSNTYCISNFPAILGLDHRQEEHPRPHPGPVDQESRESSELS